MVALVGLPSGVTVANAVEKYNGAPMITVSTNGIAAGGSISTSVSFSNPANSKISFTPIVFQRITH
jgi:hypothetical protein